MAAAMEQFISLFNMKVGAGGQAADRQLAIHDVIGRTGPHDVVFLQDVPWTSSESKLKMMRSFGTRGLVTACRHLEISDKGVLH